MLDLLLPLVDGVLGSEHLAVVTMMYDTVNCSMRQKS